MGGAPKWVDQLQRGTDVEQEQSIVANRGSKKDAEGDVEQEEYNCEGEKGGDDEEVSEAIGCQTYTLKKEPSFPRDFYKQHGACCLEGEVM